MSWPAELAKAEISPANLSVLEEASKPSAGAGAPRTRSEPLSRRPARKSVTAP